MELVTCPSIDGFCSDRLLGIPRQVN